MRAAAPDMRAEFARRCRKRGLAVTPQRLAIIRALLGSVEHPRAEAIYLRVRKQHSHISLATVHRTLETLCEIGGAQDYAAAHLSSSRSEPGKRGSRGRRRHRRS